MLSNQERALRIELQDKLWELMKSNQSLLRRKLRDRWLMEGDNNTKYFHMMVNFAKKQFCSYRCGGKVCGASKLQAAIYSF